MRHFAPCRLRIEKDVVTRVSRVLKTKGILNVRIGQQVEPAEILGSCSVSAGYRTVNLALELGVAPQSCQEYLERDLGERIYKGELLAAKKSGFWGGKKIFISPADGILDFFNPKTGEVKISFLSKRIDLPAGVFGVVESVDAERGQVIIRAQVSRIYGLAGSGRSRDGILRLLGKRDSLVTKDMISHQFEGQIVVGGSLFFRDTISAAISAGVEGLVSGGINAADYKGMAGERLIFPRKIDTDIGISAVVCEGFGSVPIGIDIFDQLQQYEGKFIFIDGNKALISLPAFSSASLTKVKNTSLPKVQDNLGLQHVKEGELKENLKVRVVGSSYLGEQGRLINIDQSPTLLSSGIKDYLATIETPRRKIQVPVANIEAIM